MVHLDPSFRRLVNEFSFFIPEKFINLYNVEILYKEHMSSMEEQLQLKDAELKESQELLTNMGNEINELYEVIKGLEEELDEAKQEIARLKDASSENNA